jgi:hypothetical protein
LIFTIFLLRKRTTGTIQLKPQKSGSWLWLELYYGIGRAYFVKPILWILLREHWNMVT